MVLLILMFPSICIYSFFLFTFQYGSTYIFRLHDGERVLTKFTFQYGSTYITVYKGEIKKDRTFTFQYGSTYIKSNKKYLRIVCKIYIPIWFYLYVLLCLICPVLEPHLHSNMVLLILQNLLNYL